MKDLITFIKKNSIGTYTTRIVRSILTEVLPYLNIFMTEELTDKEREELEELQIQIRTPEGAQEGELDEEGNPINPEETEEGTQEGEETQEPEEEPEDTVDREVWRDFPRDPATGYLVDPNTGYFLDPDIGTVIGGGSLLGETTEDTGAGDGTEEGGGNTPEGNVPEPIE